MNKKALGVEAPHSIVRIITVELNLLMGSWEKGVVILLFKVKTTNRRTQILRNENGRIVVQSLIKAIKVSFAFGYNVFA